MIWIIWCNFDVFVNGVEWTRKEPAGPDNVTVCTNIWKWLLDSPKESHAIIGTYKIVYDQVYGHFDTIVLSNIQAYMILTYLQCVHHPPLRECGKPNNVEPCFGYGFQHSLPPGVKLDQ